MNILESICVADNAQWYFWHGYCGDYNYAGG